MHPFWKRLLRRCANKPVHARLHWWATAWQPGHPCLDARPWQRTRGPRPDPWNAPRRHSNRATYTHAQWSTDAVAKSLAGRAGSDRIRHPSLPLPHCLDTTRQHRFPPTCPSAIGHRASRLSRYRAPANVPGCSRHPLGRRPVVRIHAGSTRCLTARKTLKDY